MYALSDGDFFCWEYYPAPDIHWTMPGDYWPMLRSNDGLPPSTRVVYFAQALTRRYPDLEAPKFIGPWKTSPIIDNIVGQTILIGVIPMCYDECAPFFLEQAKGCNLVCFDARTGITHLPL